MTVYFKNDSGCFVFFNKWGVIMVFGQVCFRGHGCLGPAAGGLPRPFLESLCGKLFENGAKITRMWRTWTSNSSYSVSK